MSSSPASYVKRDGLPEIYKAKNVNHHALNVLFRLGKLVQKSEKYLLKNTN